MKNIMLSFLLTLIVIPLPGQKLLDIYKNGTVKLVPDTQYGQGNNWDNVFRTYYDTMYSKPMGGRKSLVVMPDGSVIVNHRYKNYYTKFSPAGKYEKEFGIISSKGVQYKKINAIQGIIKNNTFYTGLDNMGNMICFDFSGNYIKTLKLNYMTRQMISLPNDKIAVVGWVLWSNKIREFVSIVDFETNAEKVIWEYFTERQGLGEHSKLFNYSYKFKKGGAFSITTMPFSGTTGMSSAPEIAYIGNKLIVAIPPTGEILVYDLEGKLVSKDKIGWAKNYITVAEQKDIQQKAIDKYKTMGTFDFSRWITPGTNTITAEENKLAHDEIVKQMEEDLNKISEPIPVPAFSTIVKDSDENLLFFEYPKEDNANKFNVWVYDNGGKFICQSSFVCDEYNLEINPSKMVFSNGYIYGLQLLKGATGVPLRLVRFKMTNN